MVYRKNNVLLIILYVNVTNKDNITNTNSTTIVGSSICNAYLIHQMRMMYFLCHHHVMLLIRVAMVLFNKECWTITKQFYHSIESLCSGMSFIIFIFHHSSAFSFWFGQVLWFSVEKTWSSFSSLNLSFEMVYQYTSTAFVSLNPTLI